jgi:hypothetical protein
MKYFLYPLLLTLIFTSSCSLNEKKDRSPSSIDYEANYYGFMLTDPTRVNQTLAPVFHGLRDEFERNEEIKKVPHSDIWSLPKDCHYPNVIELKANTHYSISEKDQLGHFSASCIKMRRSALDDLTDRWIASIKKEYPDYYKANPDRFHSAISIK